MFGLDSTDIIFVLLFIFSIGWTLKKEFSIMKKTGTTLVKRKNLTFMILVVLISSLLIGGLNYWIINSIGILEILMVMCLSIEMVSLFSSGFYKICENGVKVGYGFFFDWGNISEYTWNEDILIIKTKKEQVSYKFKIEKNNINKVQKIIEKNKVLPSI